MNWDDVRIFLAIARSGQLIGASARLGLNHATVSRRLAALETALDTRLVDRLTTGCRLTASGQRFLAEAEHMEAAALAASGLATEKSADLSGTVRIGAPDGFGVAFLAPRLHGLAALHPRLRTELVPVPRAFSLSRREADLAVTVERPREGRLVAAKLVDYALRLYASRLYAEQNGLPETAQDIARHRLVGYVPDLVMAPALDYAAEFGIRRPPDLAVSSALGQAAAVAAGAGIGILHAFVAAGDSRLLPVPGFADIRRTYWLVHHESGRGQRPLQAAAAFVHGLVDRERAIFI